MSDSPDITTITIERDVPCAFPEGDEMLKAHFDTIAKAQGKAFQIEREIDRLIVEVKPFRDIIKEAIEKIKDGTSCKTDCTKTIYWDEDRVEFKRNDTGEVIETRKIIDEDRQTEAAI